MYLKSSSVLFQNSSHFRSRPRLHYRSTRSMPITGADPGLTVREGAKYTARVSAREILCATPTFDVISAHDMLYEEKVNK